MPTTSNFSLRYPSNGDGPDGPGQIKNLADDVDAALPVTTAATDVSAIAPFASTLKVRRFGNVVTLTGYLTRSSGYSGTLVDCATIPSGYRPTRTLLQSASTFASGTRYEYSVPSTGVVQIRVNAESTAPMNVNMSWVTEDTFPS